VLIYEKILVVVAILVVMTLLRKAVARFVSRKSVEKQVGAKRTLYVIKTLDLLLAGLGILLALSFLGIGMGDLGIFLGSMVALLGVGLFAQWSILSNVTASIIVFFFFPYRIGDHVKILDSENTVEGTIQEIALFHVILSDKDHNTVTFPNSMVFQKAVVIQAQKVLDEEEEQG